MGSRHSPPYGRNHRSLRQVFLEEPIIALGLRSRRAMLKPVADFARFQYNKMLPFF
jgi:hypothetical protein